MSDILFDQARTLLARHFGYDAFRPPQERVVRSILSGRDTLAILPTGAGKSVCFQIPALVLGGLTIVISPLLALMEDQVVAARARGMPARALNSLLSPAAAREVQAELAAGEVRLLYVAPERCPRLLDELGSLGMLPRMLAVDEAHCIAEWGNDFRPAYLGLGRFRRACGAPLTAAFTGSATLEVRAMIARVLGLGGGAGYGLQIASFDRRNLSFAVASVANEPQRLERLVSLLSTDDVIAIVYAPTRNLVEGLARELAKRGFRAAPYHAGLAKPERARVLDDFLNDRLEVVVATCAFGMGIDKPNVRLVIHWQLPATPEAYYQEAGRAGRDGAPARCVLLYKRGDTAMARREIGVTFPPREVVERAWRDPTVLATLPKSTAAAVDRLRRELRPERGPVRWDAVKARHRAALTRLATMADYAEKTRCRRASLLAYFGEQVKRCAGCDHCGEPTPKSSWSREAMARLRLLRRAVGNVKRPWGTPILEPATLARLAWSPPANLDALAATPGVGPELAQRFGTTILEALQQSEPAASTEPASGELTLFAWRESVAARAGLPAVAIASRQLLDKVRAARPETLAGLARLPGVGPRFLAQHGESLLAALKRTGQPA